MFRLLQGFTDVNYAAYQQGQSDRFTKQMATPFITNLTGDQTVLKNSAQGLMTVDPNTRRPNNIRDLELQKYAMNVDSIKGLQNKSQVCKTTDIDTLIGSQNYGDRLRCGWIYTKGKPGDQPKVSQGELGTRDGPVGFVDNPKGTWFWDLEEAKKQILTDRCGALTTCKNVGANNYASCAFSIDRGIGVPVDKSGQLLYPSDPKLTGTNLVTSPAQCPAPPAPGSPEYLIAKSRDVCMPNPDGTLSRDCLLQQVTAAGCSKDGNLYYSLTTSAQPKNYAAGLQNQYAYNTYQQNAVTPLLMAAMKDGSTSTDIALNNFKQLATEASKVSDKSVNYAARDLCTKRGIMDDYDFCSELTNTTPPPFTLDCLQKYFGRQGGQPAGLEYPTENTRSKWNALPNWGAVVSTINQYKIDMKSTDNAKQSKALKNFLGIVRQESDIKQIPEMNGVEVLWFAMANNTFLGRRLTTNGVELPSIQATLDAVGGTGIQSLVQYITITNLRPPTSKSIRLRTETDDGSLWVLNKDINPPAYRNQAVDTNDTFSRNWDQPPTTWDSKACWNLTAKGPNYVMGSWQQTFGYSHSQTYYSECSTNNFQRIPANWMTLVQEPDAPQFSWECLPTTRDSPTITFREFRLPSLFPLNYTNTSIVETNVFPKLTGALRFSRGGVARSPNNFATNSWRTLTIAATIDVPPTTSMYRLLQFGNITIDISPGSGGNTVNVVFNWNSSTLNTIPSNGMVIKDVNADPNNPILFYVNIRSDVKGKYPNRITCSATPLARWKSGSASLSTSDPNVRTLTTSYQAPLYNSTDSAPIILGGETVNVTVGWVHMFDYELDSSDVKRDANNAWIRSMGM